MYSMALTFSPAQDLDTTDYDDLFFRYLGPAERILACLNKQPGLTV